MGQEQARLLEEKSKELRLELEKNQKELSNMNSSKKRIYKFIVSSLVDVIFIFPTYFVFTLKEGFIIT
jgi:hypothetical protein